MGFDLNNLEKNKTPNFDLYFWEFWGALKKVILTKKDFATFSKKAEINFTKK